MAVNTAGTLNYDTKMETKGVEKGIDSINAKAVAMGNLMADAIEKAAGKIIDLGKQALDSYANYEQLIGGVEKLFDKGAEKVQSYASQAYKTAGLSANAYMETVTGFSASLIGSLGGDTEKAADYADRAIRDMSDNANTFGTDIASIQNAYQGFAKQNYTMLDNLKLGYGGTKTEMERLISDANKVKEANGEMADLSIDSFADVTEAIHIMQEQQHIAGTTANEAGTTIEGSINSMKAAWENLLTGLADPNADIGQLLKNLVTSIFGDGTDKNKGVLGNVIPAVEQIFDTLIELIMQFIPKLGTYIPKILEKGAEFLISFADGIMDNIDTIIDTAYDIIISLVDGLTNNLPKLMDKATDLIIKFALKLTEPAQLQKLIESTIYLITALVTGIIKNLPKLIGAVPQIIMNIRTALINSIRSVNWGSIGNQLLTGLLNGLLNFGNAIKNAAKRIVNEIKNNIKSFFGIHSPSTVMRDEIGKFIPSGIAVGIEANTSSALKAIDDMNDEILDKVQEAYDFETGKINTSASMYNTSTIQVDSSLKDACVELDGQKVGRLITPVVSKTLKTVGG